MSEDSSIPNLGFIIVRHVNNETTNQYWKECYRCIRKFYSDPILIIDDNSNPVFASYDTSDLVDCKIIKGEFPGAGEILGYYYFHKLHPFMKAVVIHDGIFFQRYINFSSVQDVQFIWEFEHDYDVDLPVIHLLSYLDNCGELIRKYLDKNSWVGCFGVMSVISWDFLHLIEEKSRFLSIIPTIIKSRSERMSVERLYPTICQNYCKLPIKSTFGRIFAYCRAGMTYQEYLDGKTAHLPVTKVWAGR